MSYLDIIRKAMYTKYSFTRHFYTSLYSKNETSFFKPLFWSFYNDSGSYDASYELNIMLGNNLKLSINSNKLDRNYTEFYFPPAYWCNVLAPNSTNTCFYSAGENRTLRTKAYDAYVHLRSGGIAVLQDGPKLCTE